MNLRIFGISDSSTLQRLDETALSAAWQEDNQHRWIDIEAATQEELIELLAPLNLHEAIIKACLSSERGARFISHVSALYLEIPTHLGWNEPDKPYVSILCLNTTLITIHRDPLHTVEDIIRDLDVEIPLYARSSSALLYLFLVGIGRGNVDSALDVRAEAETLDQACHEHPELLDPRQISALRRKVSHCAAVHDDHIYTAGILQTVESEAFNVNQEAPHFRQLLKLAELSGRLIDGSESRVASLQRDYELSVQNSVDNRLQFLTVISAVFLPMTLITAIYGMNFNDLPAMGVPYGYIVVLVLLALSALATGAYLYWRGWFD
ncbi:hypothetical protein NG895_02480 [Aeoliella sp. ICT_H6.2]|uniref:Magnesium transporter n=1 Tax=Aeoliella straminimaris TaxID=2954799 RepID=A0A9X2JHC2_9BACT|nr:CorA family divalent cation transporter [Aeoliella straminimaris]MCO6042764.1 hypothetical protein [Aeoliella straminimaris]